MRPLLAVIVLIATGCTGPRLEPCATVLASVSEEDRSWADAILVEQCGGCHRRFSLAPGEPMPPHSVLRKSDARLIRGLTRHLEEMRGQFELLGHKAEFTVAEVEALAQFMRFMTCGGPSEFYTDSPIACAPSHPGASTRVR